MQGKLVFLDVNDNSNILYASEVLSLRYGDVYILSPYELEIIYKGIVINNETALLDGLSEKVTIENVDSGSQTYTNLYINTKDNYS